MGYYLGKKIPVRDPWWEERKDMEDYEKWWNLGFEEGYNEGSLYFKTDHVENQKLLLENSSLKQLLEANIRVIKQDLMKEYGLTELPKQQLQEVGNPTEDGRTAESN